MQSLTIERQVHFTLGRRARRVIQDGPPPVTPPPKGRVPRISRLMALAIRFDRLIKEGEIDDPLEETAVFQWHREGDLASAVGALRCAAKEGVGERLEDER